MRLSRTLVAAVVVFLPIIVSAQWTQPSASSIESTCTTPPCTVRLNAGNNGNTGLALDARGDVIATGTSTDVGAVSNVGPAAIWAAAPADQVAAVLLRSGGSEAVHLRREPTTNDFTIFTANLERLRITAGGKVGIGINPSSKLQVWDNLDAGVATYITKTTAVEAAASQLDYGMIINAHQDNYAGVFNAGRVVGSQVEGRNIGLGGVAIAMGTRVYAGVAAGVTGTVTDAYALHAQVAAGGGTVTNGYALYLANTEATNDFGVYQVGTDDSNFFAGNVAIGGAATSKKLEVYGDANFSGAVTGSNIQARYQDVAEWVEASEDLAAGTVVVLNPERNNEVMPSGRAYDTTVAGVVSLQPGLILGESGPSKEQIATTGRVKVRVDATRGAVRIGDLLVTSDVRGTAMRSEPMDVNGRSFHQPGTIIGKALEPLKEGVGEILVLLSLQ